MYRYSAPDWERGIVMSVPVCLSVCLSVRDHILGTTRPIFTNLLCTPPMAVARPLCGGVMFVDFYIGRPTYCFIFAYTCGLTDSCD